MFSSPWWEQIDKRCQVRARNALKKRPRAKHKPYDLTRISESTLRDFLGLDWPCWQRLLVKSAVTPKRYPKRPGNWMTKDQALWVMRVYYNQAGIRRVRALEKTPLTT